jgi:ABC-type multidrug transport system fused ATPase/permease subunit
VWIASDGDDTSSSPSRFLEGVTSIEERELSSDDEFPFLVGLIVICVSAIAFGILKLFYSAYCCCRASERLHDRLLWSVLRAPMSFHHRTPQGRLLNRFGRDMESVDTELPDRLSDTIICFLWSIKSVSWCASRVRECSFWFGRYLMRSLKCTNSTPLWPGTSSDTKPSPSLLFTTTSAKSLTASRPSDRTTFPTWRRGNS